MDFSDLKGMFGEVKTRMDAAIERVRRDMANVRTGRASVGLLDVLADAERVLTAESADDDELREVMEDHALVRQTVG